MDKNKMKEIKNLVENEFDSRMEMGLFSYILDKGIEYLSKVTDEEIREFKGDGFMTEDFVQALVRTAVKICKEYTTMEIMAYIKKSL